MYTSSRTLLYPRTVWKALITIRFTCFTYVISDFGFLSRHIFINYAHFSIVSYTYDLYLPGMILQDGGYKWFIRHGRPQESSQREANYSWGDGTGTNEGIRKTKLELLNVSISWYALSFYSHFGSLVYAFIIKYSKHQGGNAPPWPPPDIHVPSMHVLSRGWIDSIPPNNFKWDTLFLDIG